MADHLTAPVRGYGDIIVKTHEDGSRTVEYADDLVAVSTSLLAGQPPQPPIDIIDQDGNLAVDTAGEYRYRPVRFAQNGTVVVCERVKP